MTAKANAKVKMLTNLKKFYNDRAAGFSSIPVFASLMAEIILLIDSLTNLIKVADENNKSLVDLRIEQREMLFNALLKITRPVYAYAFKTNKLVLQEAMDITMSKMDMIKQ